jgi:hypothetical protein
LSETFVRLLPLALAGLFLPTWTLYVIALLGTARPLADSTAFVLGNVVFRTGLGVLVLFGFSISLPSEPATQSGPTPLAAALFGLGAVVVTAVGVREFLNRDTPSGAAEAVLSRFRKMTPWIAFVLGFAAVAAPGVQYVYFLGGVSIIDEAGLGTAESLALLAVFVLLLQAMLVTPIVLYAMLRSRARPALDSMETWIITRGRLVGSVILAALGVYLAFRALEYFWT